jgi:hypothetical protein
VIQDDRDIIDEERLVLTGYSVGVTAGTLVTIFWILARTLGITSLDLEALLGSWLTRRTGPETWLLGLLIHLVGSGGIGSLYAAVFRGVRRAGWHTGAVLGIVHWLAAGAAIGWLADRHPLVPYVFAPPGPFALEVGNGTFGCFFLMHFLYGTVVGTLYRLPPPARIRGEREPEREAEPRRRAA